MLLKKGYYRDKDDRSLVSIAAWWGREAELKLHRSNGFSDANTPAKISMCLISSEGLAGQAFLWWASFIPHFTQDNISLSSFFCGAKSGKFQCVSRSVAPPPFQSLLETGKILLMNRAFFAHPVITGDVDGREKQEGGIAKIAIQSVRKDFSSRYFSVQQFRAKHTRWRRWWQTRRRPAADKELVLGALGAAAGLPQVCAPPPCPCCSSSGLSSWRRR